MSGSTDASPRVTLINSESAKANPAGATVVSGGFVRAGGRQLEYRHWRQEASQGPTLVMLHEGLGSVAMWKDFPERLVAHTGCSVFAYSRAGYGKSDKTDLPRAPGYMHPEGLAVLPEVLDFLNAPTVILLGHSDGASIALIHAGAVQDDRVQALVQMAPHVFIEPLCVEQIARARTAYETGDLRARLGKYHDDVDHVFWGWNDIWLSPEFLTWNIEEYLPKVSVPVLIIQGEQDEYGTLAQVRAVRDQVGGHADTLILPACAHSSHRDQPEATLAGIRGFLHTQGLLAV